VLGEELRPGLRAWTAYHEEWEQDVRGFAIVEPERLVLVDPLLVGAQWEELEELRGGRALDVLVTVHWHVRSAAELRERHPAETTLWCFEPDRAPVEERLPVDRLFLLGDDLPGGLVALPAPPRPEVVFWDPAHATLIAGDALLGDGELGAGLHLCPEDWTHEENGLATLRSALVPVLELPVEIVGTTHGALVLEDAPAALRRALA
jgi:glyoxylase-like metal-dependent hydrolase (beta-lactamase superfamily II)